MSAKPTKLDTQRNAGAFACVTEAWRANESELHGYLRHRLADSAVADDTLQDVFVKAMQQGQGFCSLENPRAWLFQVARNALVDRARTNRPHEAFTDEMADQMRDTAATSSATTEPVDSLATCVDRVLTELSRDDADVLRECDLLGSTQQRFAKAHNLTLPAVKSRLQRARQRLREQLTKSCQVSFDAAGHVAHHVPRDPIR